MENRDEFMKNLNKMIDDYNYASPDTKNDIYMDNMERILNQFQNKQNSMQDAWQHIDFLNFDDSQHIKNYKVLTYSEKHNEYCIGWLSFNSKQQIWSVENDAEIMNDVTHWQKIIRPLKNEENEY
ncbi:MAG: hypothetical protein ACOC2U_01040 [bacterium]